MAVTYTYNPGITSDSDRVRFLVGDTDATDPLFDDGEVVFLLSEAGDVYTAAAQAADQLAARFAREVNRAVAGDGGTRVDAGQRFEHYTALARQLHERAARMIGPVPFAGGISQSDKDARAGATDRVLPAFAVDME